MHKTIKLWNMSLSISTNICIQHKLKLQHWKTFVFIKSFRNSWAAWKENDKISQKYPHALIKPSTLNGHPITIEFLENTDSPLMDSQKQHQLQRKPNKQQMWCIIFFEFLKGVIYSNYISVSITPPPPLMSFQTYMTYFLLQNWTHIVLT